MLLNDTIVAVSSPTSHKRVIVRITGPATVEACKRIFGSPISAYVAKENALTAASATIDDELEVEMQLYLFFSPHSYTGEDVAEIHIHTNPAVTAALLDRLLQMGLRSAGPGEFTARAYLNGKIDLAQAEAVNEVIVSSNTFQLAAAEKLLSGRLSQTIAQVRSAIMDCLSLIEAGLDFSGEDIEVITRQKATDRLHVIKKQLEELLSGSISDESVIDLPAVGIAGATNVGKSSLINRLLGTERSIVSDQQKTTRDVLTGLLTLKHYKCVLFDCAGLIPEPSDILDELAQQAATEALRNSDVVVFCADISKGFPQSGVPDWTQDALVRRLIKPKVLIPAATKCDLLCEKVLSDRLAKLQELFGIEFLPISSKTGAGTKLLRETIDRKLVEEFKIPRTSGAVLTARHKQAVTEAIENVSESTNELRAGNDEVTAMMLRAAYHTISGIEQHNVDDEILDKIFSRFCIGK